MEIVRNEKMILTEEEVQKIRQGSVLESEPLQICNCKENKILIKVQPYGAGRPEIEIKIMCMGCGREFEGFVTKSSDMYYFKRKVLEINEILYPTDPSNTDIK